MTDELSIETTAVTPADRTVIEAAERATRDAFDPDRFGGAHLVGAAIEATDGTVTTGVSLPASVGRTSMCAEPVAVGAAIADGVESFERVAAVRHPLPNEDRAFEVVAPCGACRELLADYGESIRVVVPGTDEPRVAAAIDLLPGRTW